ncbi:hydroxymethylpyrimidine/phosphomethylpyrimidine kinase [Kordia sp.]|uniref:hydroxymethylpyrimidine/phosphomethylpyrimidine kinase n=1 Tax=Kordia sp. TaxID=1965332 RepID=UPI0025C2C9E4|nr:hydroxymethylpyrimidine/phosphomethylpyrimidine kinase [Kordia sp.]MCH2193664.1 hydroxymethylpyrimidine/phosphomethylpyrimidine kinase [Kordia sp.]
MKKRPHIVTIAGFDPSNGAGFTSDIKTFEALKCYGLAVCTANTIQDDIEFHSCYWTPIEVILEQISLLFKRFDIAYVKIGIVEDWQVLSKIIDRLLKLSPDIKIILDPVLRSSSNFTFHSTDEAFFDQILDKIYLLTPNYDEIKQLYSDKNIEQAIQYISSKTNLFLKGGHKTDNVGQDTLFTLEGKQFNLNPKSSNCTEKHGSGCVLSSAITSYLALGFPLLKACYGGKRYTERFLSSNSTLLGYHSKN